ncbi:hypothetical protein SAMN05216174_10450 [Actinokineospora iranica]|uniref:Mobilisation protein (MobC) n=2 Tax=Actinokineospora iranica TaxID=1271860 RepID=A0A1G6P064_9PSEU|nr:hypothetical protein SAMN05216174_10450 [Actinokineospora iranica]
MVAAREGMKPGAWAQQAAYEAALRRQRGEVFERGLVHELIAELREQRRVLANIGGSLNQLAKVANSTGGVEHLPAAQGLLRVVRNVVRASDELVARVRAELLP